MGKQRPEKAGVFLSWAPSPALEGPFLPLTFLQVVIATLALCSEERE